ncbi:MAG: S-layer homology domain-containing protein [Candidatus Aminicenantales bacterium]
MKRGAWLLLIIIVLTWGSACLPPPPSLTPPPFPLESLPPAITATMSLQERLIAEEAWNELRRGNLPAAEISLAKLRKLGASFYLITGFIQLTRMENAAAKESFEQVLADFPRLSLAYAGLAQAYLNLGDKEAAFTALREVLKEEPENKRARELFNELKENRTNELREAAGQAIKQGNLTAAKEALLQGLHYSPEAVDLHLTLAQVYRQEKNLASALTHLRAAVDLAPRQRDLLRQYAEALLEAEQYSRSLDAFERLLELNPGDKEIQARLAAIKDKLGIVELPSQYDAIPRLETVTREDVAALIAVKFKNFLPRQGDSPPIIIDIATSWASRFIIQTASLGFLEVYSDHTFRPKNIVTRAEMAETLARMVHYFREQGKKLVPQIPREKILIPDVSQEHAYYTSIIEAISYQLMELSTDKLFKPDSPVSGLEAARTMDVLLSLIR